MRQVRQVEKGFQQHARQQSLRPGERPAARPPAALRVDVSRGARGIGDHRGVPIRPLSGPRIFPAHLDPHTTLGIILLIIGVVLTVLESTGRAIGGRKNWY